MLSSVRHMSPVTLLVLRHFVLFYYYWRSNCVYFIFIILFYFLRILYLIIGKFIVWLVGNYTLKVFLVCFKSRNIIIVPTHIQIISFYFIFMDILLNYLASGKVIWRLENIQTLNVLLSLLSSVWSLKFSQYFSCRNNAIDVILGRLDLNRYLTRTV